MKKRFISKLCVVLIAIAFIIPQTGCAREEPIEKTGFYLDTVCTISIYGMNDNEANEIIDLAFDLCRKYENILSKTVEKSDIYRINHSGGKPIKVKSETMDILCEGKRMGQLSNGKFDISIGKLTELWNFDVPEDEDGNIPDKEKLEEALNTIDYRNIKTGEDTAWVDGSGGMLDLGGIAKGYIADKLTKCLIDAGVKRAIINLGGNIVAIGEKDKNTPWEVGIERPFSHQTQVVGSVELSNQTIVTAGIYERFFKKDGETYHHILDVDTGYPVENDLVAVTIVGKTGKSMECDALSTTCLLLGEKDGLKLIATMDGFGALFMDKEGNIKATDNLDFKKK